MLFDLDIIFYRMITSLEYHDGKYTIKCWEERDVDIEDILWSSDYYDSEEYRRQVDIFRWLYNNRIHFTIVQKVRDCFGKLTISYDEMIILYLNIPDENDALLFKLTWGNGD